MMSVDFLLEAFFWRALIGGTCVAIIAGVLGCFIVWRRLAYFGDTLAHSGLLGVTLSILFSLPLYLCLGTTGALLGLSLLWLQKRLPIGNDTLLGILSHTALALGLVILSVMKNPNVNVLGLLYGDILALSWQDVGFICIGSLLLLTIMTCIWTPLLRLTISAQLAKVEGVPVERIEAIFVMMIALSVAIAIKIVGVLLITALLIIPPACARALTQTPKTMTFTTIIISIASVSLGILASFFYDIPTGPSIVVTTCSLFVLSTGWKHLLQ